MQWCRNLPHFLKNISVPCRQKSNTVVNHTLQWLIKQHSGLSYNIVFHYINSGSLDNILVYHTIYAYWFII